MMFYAGLLVGLMLGCFFGVVMMCILITGREE